MVEKNNTKEEITEKEESTEIEIENLNPEKEVGKETKEAKPKKPKKLSSKEKIAALEIEVAELKDKYIRSAAEFDNFRRRSAVEKQTWIKNAAQRVILDVCDVQDNFERALHPDNENIDMESFTKGIEMIYQQMDNILKKEGVAKIESMNAEFDPKFHEALAHIPSELDENVIAAVIQNGYVMNDKVIRPARVAVSNGVPPEGVAPEPTPEAAPEKK